MQCVVIEGPQRKRKIFGEKTKLHETKARRSLSYSRSVLSIAADKYITQYSGEIERNSRSLKEKRLKYSFI